MLKYSYLQRAWCCLMPHLLMLFPDKFLLLDVLSEPLLQNQYDHSLLYRRKHYCAILKIKTFQSGETNPAIKLVVSMAHCFLSLHTVMVMFSCVFKSDFRDLGKKSLRWFLHIIWTIMANIKLPKQPHGMALSWIQLRRTNQDLKT